MFDNLCLHHIHLLFGTCLAHQRFLLLRVSAWQDKERHKKEIEEFSV
jgi:hypothetical protein